MKPFTSVPLPPSGLVTTTFQAHAGAFRRLNLQVMVVGDDTATFEAVIFFVLLVSLTIVVLPAPVMKSVPLTVTYTLVFPLVALPGVIDVTEGADAANAGTTSRIS